MSRLYLMRHGQTLFNELHRIQGACDSPLTDLGKKQTLAAKKYFDQEKLEWTGLYSSTQERASDTLEIVAPNQPYTRLKGIKEWDFGRFEGMPDYLNPPIKEGQESYGDYFKDYDGEGVGDVEARMTATLTDVMNTHTSGNILAVTHGGAMYAFYLKWRKPNNHRPTFSNCCILVYDYKEGEFNLLESINPF